MQYFPHDPLASLVYCHHILRTKLCVVNFEKIAFRNMMRKNVSFGRRVLMENYIFQLYLIVNNPLDLYIYVSLIKTLISHLTIIILTSYSI